MSSSFTDSKTKVGQLDCLLSVTTRAKSLNNLAIPMTPLLPLPLLVPLPLLMLPIKQGSYIPETPRETLEDHWHWLMTAASESVDVSLMFPRPPVETLFKDCYFMNCSGIGSGIENDLKIQLRMKSAQWLM